MTNMKIRASDSKICEKWRLICRGRRIRVICANLRHKQRQGWMDNQTRWAPQIKNLFWHDIEMDWAQNTWWIKIKVFRLS